METADLVTFTEEILDLVNIFVQCVHIVSQSRYIYIFLRITYFILLLKFSLPYIIFL